MHQFFLCRFEIASNSYYLIIQNVAIYSDCLCKNSKKIAVLRVVRAFFKDNSVGFLRFLLNISGSISSRIKYVLAVCDSLNLRSREFYLRH